MSDDEKSEEEMLCEMLSEGRSTLFLSGDAGPFFTADGPDKTPLSIWVNCNDLFAWACADAEPLPLSELPAVYAEWKATGDLTTWACKRRGLRPQAPIEKRMRERGEWNDELEALPKPPPS